MRGAKCILRIDDIYPDTLIATGHFSKENIFMKFYSFTNKILYQSFEHIVVLGRDMEHLVKKKLGSTRQQITIIPNWADIDLIKPVPKEENILLNELGLNNKFIINLAGNMGLAQGIENLQKAVEILKDEDDIHFLFIGSGAKKKWMEKEINAKGLKNITLMDQLPRTEQQNFLNACDIGLITLLPGMTGAGVPSRLYNIMSAGKPIIAITGFESESEFVIREEGIGWFDCAPSIASTNSFGLPASTNQPIPSSLITNSDSDSNPVIAIIGFPADIMLYSRLGTPAPVIPGSNVINPISQALRKFCCSVLGS
jgi:glycosyltransferase involved in cell wall biosynthesis